MYGNHNMDNYSALKKPYKLFSMVFLSVVDVMQRKHFYYLTQRIRAIHHPPRIEFPSSAKGLTGFDQRHILASVKKHKCAHHSIHEQLRTLET